MVWVSDRTIEVCMLPAERNQVVGADRIARNGDTANKVNFTFFIRKEVSHFCAVDRHV